jgi:hypothetical protein
VAQAVRALGQPEAMRQPAGCRPIAVQQSTQRDFGRSPGSNRMFCGAWRWQGSLGAAQLERLAAAVFVVVGQRTAGTLADGARARCRDSTWLDATAPIGAPRIGAACRMEH